MFACLLMGLWRGLVYVCVRVGRQIGGYLGSCDEFKSMEGGATQGLKS